MFLNAKLFSGSRGGGLVLGIVFVCGMLAATGFKGPMPAATSARTIAASPRLSMPGPQDLRFARGRHAAEVLRVNDGDTFEARVHVSPGMQVRTRVRLHGIDAAELSARCPAEYRMAISARNALQRMLAEGGVTIHQIGFDKYSRVLASVATRRTPDISEALLKTGLVRAYDGGRRESWCR